MMKKLLVIFTIMTMTLIGSVFADTEDYGAAGASTHEEYTLEEMLTYAIQDEYLARSEYEKIIEKFGEIRPFTNIIKSEEYHIELLLPLIDKYEVEVVEDTSYDHIIIPETLLESLQTGVVAEVNNIGMYENFLEKQLPEDVRDVFEVLKNASENHLKAFENGAEREESALGTRSATGRSNNTVGNSNTSTNGRRGNAGGRGRR